MSESASVFKDNELPTVFVVDETFGRFGNVKCGGARGFLFLQAKAGSNFCHLLFRF